LTSKHGASGAFFNGLLATFLATSCSAPFLGAALGVASAQKSPVIVMVMLSAGLGLAAPYLVLSWQPGWLKFLPKPGPWMDRFKVALGFPMLATAIWLLNLLTTHYGDRTWWMGMFLVVLAIAAWVFGQFVQRASENRGVGLFVVFLFLILGYYVLANQLRWRDLEKESQITNNLQDGKDGVPWQKWSPEAVAAAQAKGLPVVVDFTAKWCLTCQGNKLVLESSAVRTKIKQIGAVPLLADYTRRPEYMTAELNHRGRDAVPMILVFSRDAAKEPVVFDLVTPDALNKALDQATR
jgi:thiol:disulfide interchange protein DsbD